MSCREIPWILLVSLCVATSAAAQSEPTVAPASDDGGQTPPSADAPTAVEAKTEVASDAAPATAASPPTDASDPAAAASEAAADTTPPAPPSESAADTSQPGPVPADAAAAPVAGASPAAPTTASAEPPPVRILAEDGKPLALYLRDGEIWRPLCDVPCEIEAPRDPQGYGVSSLEPGASVRDAGRLWVAPGDGVEVQLRRRRRVRLAGAATMGVSAVSLLVWLIAAGAEKGQIAIPLIGGSFAAGMIMYLMPDKASVRRCIGCAGGR